MSQNPKTFTVRNALKFDVPDVNFTLADGESTIKPAIPPTITLENNIYFVYDATYKKTADESDDILVLDEQSGKYFPTSEWYKESKFKIYKSANAPVIFAQIETAIATKFFTQLKKTKETDTGQPVSVTLSDVEYNFPKFRSTATRVLTMKQTGTATNDPTIKSEQINGPDLKNTGQVLDALTEGKVTALRAYTDIAGQSYGFGLSKRGALWFIQAPRDTDYLLVAHQFIKIFTS
jgi:hypothetical protein